MPRSLFSMDGNFDFPPANDPDNELVRYATRFNRLRGDPSDLTASRAPIGGGRQTDLDSPHPAGSQTRQWRGSSSAALLTLPLQSMTSREAPQRPSPTLSSPRAQRNTGMRRTPSESLDPTLIRYARQQIVETNAELQRVQSSLGEIQPDRATVRLRLNKRRKLDHDSRDDPAAGSRTFRYGHFGQVVEGLLRMEIVSCDGGEFSRDPPRHSGERYKPENVLSDDDRVYCTKAASCNLLLRHLGESSFTLQSITVRAPKKGYTAPIQQGLVFVGNDAQELLAGTRDYSIRYGTLNNPPAPASAATRDWEIEQLTLLESLRDDDAWERSLLRRNADQRGDEAARELATYFTFDDQDDEAAGDSNEDPDVCDEVATAPTPPPYEAAATSADDEDFDPESQHLRELDRQRALLRSLNRDPEIDEDLLDRLRRRLDDDPPPRLGRRTPRRRATPGQVVQVQPSNAAPVDGERIKPLRTFFIRPPRNEAKITFEPPISARFVLLKLFSSMTPGGGNIDIEYVGVTGFAGPRFFPATQPK